jgi:hypothetical protein
MSRQLTATTRRRLDIQGFERVEETALGQACRSAMRRAAMIDAGGRV